MRESVAQRRDMATLEENRRSSTPVDPASGGELNQQKCAQMTTTDSENITLIDSESTKEESGSHDTSKNNEITIVLSTKL